MKRFFAGTLLIASIAVLSVSLWNLAGMFWQEKKDDALLQRLREIYEDADRTRDAPEGEDDQEGNPSNTGANAGLLALHKKNGDCIGWLKIPHTKIDYPVMYRPEKKNYYLRRDFNGNYSLSGSLFISEICDPETSDNIIIYGHHMKSGKMFAALEGYKKESFYRKHPKIIFRTLHGNEKYQVIAAFSTPVYTGRDFAYYAFSKAADELEFQEYVDAVKKRSYYETGNTAVYGDKLLTLSTCEYSHRNGRMVVVAKKIIEGGL